MKKFMKTFKFAVGIITAGTLMCFLTHPTAFAKRDKQYVAKQIRNIKIDRKLDEWKRAEIVAFDERIEETTLPFFYPSTFIAKGFR